MFTKSQLEFLENKKIALACSGGVDSMVLAHMLLQHSISFELIHCNFQLRNMDSDRDEQFVVDFARKNNLKIYTTKFSTADSAKKNRVSIEMEARRLRYAFFDQLKEEHNFDLILLGHHKDDHVETVFMRIITGTGLSGLEGIRRLHHSYYRPLWLWNKDKIKAYANKNKIEYCYDYTNSSNDYLRNRLRNTILPEIKSINPSYADAFVLISDLAVQSNALLAHIVGTQKLEWQQNRSFDIAAYSRQAFLPIALAFILEDSNINRTVIQNLAANANTRESKYFELDAGMLEVKQGRITLIDTPISESRLFATIDDILSHAELKAEIVRTNPTEYRKDYFYLDMDKLKFPLIYRPMQTGDKMKGLGMTGSKKLTTIAQELQWTKNQKNQNTVWQDRESDIIMVRGWRVSEKVKIDNSTTNILIIKK